MTAPPGPPAGWFPDPAEPVRQRWWDGRRWTEHVALGGLVLPQAVPLGQADDPGAGPAWHPDPVAPKRLRWWDGGTWTDQVAEGGAVRAVPLPVDAAAEAAQHDERAPWPGWVAGAGLGLGLLSAVLAGLLVVLGDVVGLDGDAASLALASVGLYSGLLASCWFVHKRCATGRSFRADFGLRYRRGDWWRGLVGSFLARAGVLVVVFVIVLVDEDAGRADVDAFEEGDLTAGLLVAFALTALVLAPVVEELFFRGLLMRSLETVVPAWLAVAVQAVLFGIAHTSANLGTGDLVIVGSTAAAGAVFGLMARRYRRLGPTVAAHAWFNLVAFLALLVLAGD
jgi:membrane protease YdiL (CAAX protease family)